MAEQKSTGMATASLVLGIVSLVICWIPFINFLTWITAIVGLILGIVGAVKKQGGAAIAGIILCAVALFLPIIVLGSIFGGVAAVASGL